MNDDASIRVTPSCRNFGGAYEPTVYDFLKAHVRPGDVVVDVGAHVGIYTVLFAQWVGGSGHVLAVEPSHASVRLLRRHLRLNHVADRVTVLEAASGALPGSAALQESGSSVYNTLSSEAHGLSKRHRTTEVRVATLDEVCAEQRKTPHLVKIDTEGWDLRVLEGATRLLATRPAPIFVVELHPYAWASAGHSAAEFREFLRVHDLELTCLTGQADPFERHGTVVLLPRTRST